MTRGQVAADRLRAAHARPPAPPTTTALATTDGPMCTRCQPPAARVVPAYWDPTARYCPPCCHELAAGFGADPTNWPPRPYAQEPAA